NQAEKLKSDNGEKLSDDEKKTLDEAVEAAKKVIKDEKADKDALEAAAKELNDKIMPIGAKLYEQSSEKSETEDDKSKDEGKKKGEPVEGEVVDEDKDTKEEK